MYRAISYRHSVSTERGERLLHELPVDHDPAEAGLGEEVLEPGEPEAGRLAQAAEEVRAREPRPAEGRTCGLLLPELPAQSHAFRLLLLVQARLIWWRAPEVKAMFSQLRLGAAVRRGLDLDDVPGLAARVLSGAGLPLIRAPAAWRPISEWMRKAKSRADAPDGQRNDPPLGREDVDLFGDEVDLEVLEEFLGVLLLARRARPSPAATAAGVSSRTRPCGSSSL